MRTDKPDCLNKIRTPGGDTAENIKIYQEYVCERIAEDLTFEEIRELLAYFHCPVELLTDRIVEAKLRDGKAAARVESIEKLRERKGY